MENSVSVLIYPVQRDQSEGRSSQEVALNCLNERDPYRSGLWLAPQPITGGALAIADHVCENRGQEGGGGALNLNNIALIGEGNSAGSCAQDFKDFKWGLIAASAGDDDLFITAPVLQLCIHVQKA